MKERPILFSTPMVQAILSGQKTQTRRVMKPQPVGIPMSAVYGVGTTPYGIKGDQLWVRETWQKLQIYDCDDMPTNEEVIFYKADGKPDIRLLDSDGIEKDDQTFLWRPSIHMPRRASRIQLEITNIRVERVQDITAEEAISEGVKTSNFIDMDYPRLADTPSKCHAFIDYNAIGMFEELWDSINSKRGYSWDSNPWVWVVEFKRIEK